LSSVLIKNKKLSADIRPNLFFISEIGEKSKSYQARNLINDAMTLLELRRLCILISLSRKEQQKLFWAMSALVE